MKQLLLLSICLLFSLVSFGQESESTANNTEIGLNVTSLVTRIVGNSGQEITPTYALSVKRRMKENRYFRSAFGLDVSNSNSEIELDEKSSLMGARIGIEKRIEAARNFYFYYGIDVIGSYFKETISNQVLQIDEQMTSIGGGPVFGFHYSITESIALELESNLTIYSSWTTNETKFIDPTFPFPSEKDNKNGFGASINLPQWLFFIVKF